MIFLQKIFYYIVQSVRKIAFFVVCVDELMITREKFPEEELI